MIAEVVAYLTFGFFASLLLWVLGFKVGLMLSAFNVSTMD